MYRGFTMISKKRLSRQFDRAVSPLFQRDALLLIDRCYRAADAAKDTYGLHSTIAGWNRPLLRRSLIQSQLFELAQTYGLKPEWRRTLLGNNPYVYIPGGKFVLTESKIAAPGMLPVYADYRSSHSG